MDFKCTAGILSFPVGLASLASGLSAGVCVCMHVWQSVWMCIDAARNLQTLYGYFEQLLFTTLGSDII